MHDIRKPYTRSKSDQGLNSRIEQFETRSSRMNKEVDEDGPVEIPRRKVRRDLSSMDMYPRRRMNDIRDAREEDNYEENEAGGRVYSRRRNRDEGTFGSWIFIGVILIMAVAAGLLTYVFDTATVTIVPKYSDINDFNKKIVFSLTDASSTGVPFILASSTLTKSKTLSLSDSKKVEAKASGIVTIYNNYDASSQKLIKNTRLESASGKIYRIGQSIIVPGKKAGVPGSISVTVYADSYGPLYNVESTTFTIPGFKGTPREKAFYAKNKTAISGGSSGNVSLASLADLNAAKDELALELDQEIKASLNKIQKDGYIGLYGAREVIYTDNQSDILKGVTNTYQVKAVGYLILADGAKLAQAVASNLRDYANEKVRLDYAETLNFTKKDTDHLASSTSLTILAEGKPRVVWVTDFDAVKELVKAKKRDEFKPIMKGLVTIQGAEISFSPLWLSSFPSDTKKISIIESLPKR